MGQMNKQRSVVSIKMECDVGMQGRIQPLSKVGVHIRLRWGFTSDIL